MLNARTRDAVRAPHSLDMVKKKVKEAKAQFDKHIPDYAKARDAAIARFYKEVGETKGLERTSPSATTKLIGK